jgi:hypothetical protein
MSLGMGHPGVAPTQTLVEGAGWAAGERLDLDAAIAEAVEETTPFTYQLSSDAPSLTGRADE